MPARPAGTGPDRVTPVRAGVARGYALAQAIWATGGVSNAKPDLPMNFLLDRDEAHWAGELARLKAHVGACPAQEPVTAASALQGSFSWTCERGQIAGGVLLAPTMALSRQSLTFEAIES